MLGAAQSDTSSTAVRLHRDVQESVSQRIPQLTESPSHLRLVEPVREPARVLTHRDPEAIRQAFPVIAALADKYFRAEISGSKYLSDKASLTVSTHNGGMAMPDLYCLFVAFFRRFGLETPVYGMAHNAAFKIPVFGPMVSRFGAIPASQKNAKLVLKEGHPLVICPGGDEDNLKPWADRHQIRFGRRRGFIRLAIEEQVPIVPVVSVGAHETMMVLNDGTKLAKALKLDKVFRVKSAPLALGFPFGLNIAGLGAIPLPSKIKIRILPAIELHEPPSAASDTDRVERCYQHVHTQMQRALTDLAAQRKYFFG